MSRNKDVRDAHTEGTYTPAKFETVHAGELNVNDQALQSE